MIGSDGLSPHRGITNGDGRPREDTESLGGYGGWARGYLSRSDANIIYGDIGCSWAGKSESVRSFALMQRK